MEGCCISDSGPGHGWLLSQPDASERQIKSDPLITVSVQTGPSLPMSASSQWDLSLHQAPGLRPTLDSALSVLWEERVSQQKRHWQDMDMDFFLLLSSQYVVVCV